MSSTRRQLPVAASCSARTAPCIADPKMIGSRPPSTPGRVGVCGAVSLPNPRTSTGVRAVYLTRTAPVSNSGSPPSCPGGLPRCGGVVGNGRKV
ncbi:hypothetical protein [Kutzneria buriramensis]|uniref:hypothetical protein n=1 Tax=Kutzneria buriramensis TaxID=1045776 RepID=UPI000E26D18B|nr:hypothetical protein [Kutzneria buriramensis]